MDQELRQLSMSEEHKGRLQKKLIHLKEDMQVIDVVEHLFAKNAFAKSAQVKAQATRSEQVGVFLDYFTRGSEYSWKCFIEALADVNQKYIAEYLQGNDTNDIHLQRMGKDHKRKLEEHRMNLIETLMVGDVLDYIIENDTFFNDSRYAKVNSETTMHKRVVVFLDLLKTGSEHTWSCFIKALDHTQQPFIRNYLVDSSTENAANLKENTPTVNATVSNEDKIDISNQPLLEVKHSRQTFYENNQHKAYPMNMYPRGLVCIINVKKVENHKPRLGTDIDRDNLIRLFQGLHYHVRDNFVYNDDDGLTANGILSKVRAFAQSRDHGYFQSAVLCVLSHGGNGVIKGTDGENVKIMDIRHSFNNEDCSALKNKPKLLFFQACRGGAADEGVVAGDVSDKVVMDMCQPSHGDMLIGFPTVDGYVAWRNTEHGSWYISALVKVFSEHACDLNIFQLLMEVRNVLSKNINTDGNVQCSEELTNLNKDFYFFPGITPQ